MKKYVVIAWASLALLSCNGQYGTAMKSADKNFILETREKVGNPNVNNLEEGDTLTIKIQTENQAKIISIKGNKINNEKAYFWLIATPIIFSIGVFPYILLYRKGGNKHKTKIIKLLIICVLTSCLIAHSFTS